MKRAHCVIVRACSWLAGHAGASIIGLAVVWMASVPRPAWSQSAWPSYPNNNAISITSSGNVGIGTINPRVPLQIGSGTSSWNTSTGLEIWQPSLPSNQVGNLNIYSTDPIAADTGGSIGLGGSFPPYNPYVYAKIAGRSELGSGGNGYLQFLTTAANTAVYERMRITSSGNVGIGTTNPTYLLSVKGTVGAQEFIVTNTGWSDYVFQPGYRLRPLSEVGAYIQANHHLPDIPSEAEVEEKGFGVGEMQSKLLAKVEELTLHMIQQEKENQELRERIARLEKGAAGDAKPTAAK